MKPNRVLSTPRWGFLGVFLPLGSIPALGTTGDPAMPKPFPPSHYERLEEYSPFVKSLESAKLMEKSPDLVIVGYGRVRGEDHVIVQQKDNVEKREKIGARWGSATFPYRLLSVTNVSDRKTFKATLEDRNGRRRDIGYASESQPVAAVAVTGGSPSPVPAAAPTGLTNFVGRPAIALPQPPTVEGLEKTILDLDAKINNPATSEGIRLILQKQLEGKKKELQLLQNPQDLPAAEVAPQAAQ